MSADKRAIVVSGISPNGARYSDELRGLGWECSVHCDSTSFLLEVRQPHDAAFALVDYPDNERQCGLQLLQALEDADVVLPVILLASTSDPTFVCRAISQGVATILLRPTNTQLVEEAIQTAIDFRPVLNLRQQVRVYTNALSLLTDREQKILKLAVEGWPNKRIAALLDVSVKTIERSPKIRVPKT